MPRLEVESTPTAGALGPSIGDLFAALPVAVVVVDPDDRIAQVNALAEQMLNVSERQMLDQPLAAVLDLPAGGRSRDGQGVALYDVTIETARGIRMRVDFVESALADHPGWRIIALHAAARRGGSAMVRTAPLPHAPPPVRRRCWRTRSRTRFPASAARRS